jgi:C4-dicarboxylate transporter DctM subunit
MVVLLIFKLPIGFSMAIASAAGYISIMGVEGGVSEVVNMYSFVWNDFAIVSLPLYVFLGYIMHKSGMARELFHLARVLIGHLPGGLAVAALIVCAFFAAISGSSTANALTVGLIAIPAMASYNYDKKMSAGVVAVGGTLGILIPPSAAMIMIGVLSQESIGQLFMAGLVPGVIAVILLSITAIITSKKTGANRNCPRPPAEVIAALRQQSELNPALDLLGGMYTAYLPLPKALPSRGLCADLCGSDRPVRFHMVGEVITNHKDGRYACIL